MDQQERLNIFKAQTQNVRELKSTWKHLKRSIHVQLLQNKDEVASVYTRLLALTYCAWIEALFAKLIHTPYGFELDEIEQIKRETRDKGSTAGWQKCVSLALKRVEAKRSGILPNMKQTLDRFVKQYIENPSVLRNKIAHGQVKIALNRENTDINNDLTAQLKGLNVVILDRHKQACQGLADIVEAIIESPKKSAMRDYWTLSEQIKEQLKTTEMFTLQSKLKQLRSKASHFKRHA